MKATIMPIPENRSVISWFEIIWRNKQYVKARNFNTFFKVRMSGIECINLKKNFLNILNEKTPLLYKNIYVANALKIKVKYDSKNSYVHKAICLAGFPIPDKEAHIYFTIEIPSIYNSWIFPYYQLLFENKMIPQDTLIDVKTQRSFTRVTWKFKLTKEFTVSLFYIYISHMRLLREEPSFVCNFLTLTKVFNLKFYEAMAICKKLINGFGHVYFKNINVENSKAIKEFIINNRKYDKRPFIGSGERAKVGGFKANAILTDIVLKNIN